METNIFIYIWIKNRN